MTAKEYLSEYQWASKEARSLLDSIETIQTRLESTAAKQLEAEGAQHSGSGRDVQSELIIRKVELEEMLLRKYKEILAEIFTLSPAAASCPCAFLPSDSSNHAPRPDPLR